MIAEASAQYRSRYAEVESRLACLCPGTFDFVMVVPVYAESSSFIDSYRPAVHKGQKLLVIAVLNGRIGAVDSVNAVNTGCFRELSARFSLREVGRGGWLGRDGSMSLLVVDRFTPGRLLPTGQGVGLARKIGADIALELIAAGRVRNSFFSMTDADASLPVDYFGRVGELKEKCSAGIFPLWHEPSGKARIDRGTALYEVGLRYFQRGLHWANSPYAFHSLGSTIVVNALCYAQVRGVPLRQAGEDFYLLCKLSKIRPLARLHGEPVRLQSRFSDRVPFGTGRGSYKLGHGDDLILYHPNCFAAVREVTTALNSSVESWPVLRRLASERIRLTGDGLVRENIGRMCSGMSPAVRSFLQTQGAFRAWQRIGEQAPDSTSRVRRLHEWFDGFRTLKLIHHVRKLTAASLPWGDAIRRAPFMDGIKDDGGCLSKIRMDLLRRERDLPSLVGPTL